MKKLINVAVMVVLLAGLMVVPAMAEGPEVSVGADLVSSYVWRGTKFGEGAALQPSVELSANGFAIGAWGSFGLAKDDATEADLYVSYSFDFGLSVGLTDYYFPISYDDNGDLAYSDYMNSDNHTQEANLGYGIGPLSLSANMYLDSNSDNDKYFEVGYDLGLASVFVGAGDKSYTTDGKFALCNIGVSAEKEVKVTDTFSIPLTGSVILNPDSGQMYVVVAMSF